MGDPGGGALLLTRAQAAQLLNIGTTRVDELIASGELASIPIGEKRYRDGRVTAAIRRVPRSACEAWIERRLAEQAAAQ